MLSMFPLSRHFNDFFLSPLLLSFFSFNDDDDGNEVVKDREQKEKKLESFLYSSHFEPLFVPPCQCQLSIPSSIAGKDEIAVQNCKSFLYFKMKIPSHFSFGDVKHEIVVFIALFCFPRFLFCKIY